MSSGARGGTGFAFGHSRINGASPLAPPRGTVAGVLPGSSGKCAARPGHSCESPEYSRRAVSIGAAASMSGVSIETIRYYERTGVVPRAARTQSGRRIYDEEGIARLRFVKRCRMLGFSIPDTRALLRLAEDGEAPCSEVKALGARHLSDIRSKIEHLSVLARALAALLDRCEDGRVDCPMLGCLLFGPDPPTPPD